ncbi:MAG: Hpt domain-containing protein [Desulfobacterales bacterium]|nr:Hpt domain-containing protein [Desulfobacterales bacterium]
MNKEDDAEIKLPSHLPGLNLESGLEKIGGNKKLYKKVLKDFDTGYADFSNTLTNEYQVRKMDDVKQMIHAIKGVSGNIGADELHSISKEIDECLKNNQLDGLDNKFKMFNEAIKTVLNSIHHLQSYNSQNESIKVKSLDVKELMEELTKIDELLSQSYPESEDLFDSIKNDLINLGFEEQTQKIAEHIEDFEYKEAKKILEILKNKLGT